MSEDPTMYAGPGEITVEHVGPMTVLNFGYFPDQRQSFTREAAATLIEALAPEPPAGLLTFGCRDDEGHGFGGFVDQAAWDPSVVELEVSSESDHFLVNLTPDEASEMAHALLAAARRARAAS